MDGAPLPEKHWIDCPGCRESFDLTAEPQAARTVSADGLLRCPYCSTPFLAPASVSAKELSMPAEPTHRDPEPEFFVTDDLPIDYEQNVVRGGTQIADQMTADKVHRLAAARRNAYRRRSWFTISAGLLAVASVKFITLIVYHLRLRDSLSSRVPMYSAAAIVMLLLAARLVQRAIRLTQRLRESDLEEPTEAPDFAPLESGNADTPDWHRINQN